MKSLYRCAALFGSAWLVASCASPPPPHVDARLGPLSERQSDVLRSCYVDAGFAGKLVELREEGLSSDAILQRYRDAGDPQAAAVAARLLPSVERDNPERGTAFDYALQRYRSCIAAEFPVARDKESAASCYQLSQFVEVAQAARKLGQPMQLAYQRVSIDPAARPTTQALLERLALIDDDEQAVALQVDSYFECVGLPTK